MECYRLLFTVALLLSVQSVFSMGRRPKGSQPVSIDERFIERIVDASSYENLLRILESMVVEKGANINAVDKDGYNAVVLLVTHWKGDEMDRLEKVLNFLVQHGVDVNARNSKNIFSPTPLLSLIAVPSEDLSKKDKLKRISSLLKYGADVMLTTEVNQPFINKKYKWKRLTTDQRREIEHLGNLTASELARAFELGSISAYLETFNQGLESFLDHITEFKPLKVGNSILNEDFFQQHMKNALKSKNYNQERIKRYYEKQKKKQLLEQAKKDQWTDVLIFTGQ